MDIRVYDKELYLQGVTDELVSVIWEIGYFTFGTAKILAPMTENNRTLFVPGNIIVKHDEYIDLTDSSGNVWRRAALISFVHYSKDNTGQEQIEIAGTMLGGLLNNRVITPQLQINGTPQAIVNRLVSKNAGADADSARQFPQYSVITQEDLGGTAVDYSNEELATLGEEVLTVCQQGKIGIDIMVCEKERLYGFYLYKGQDLTADNTHGNNPALFSTSFDNIIEQQYEHDTGNTRTYAYVTGAEDDNGDKETVEVDGTEATGFERREIFIDASDISREADDGTGEPVTIPAATYTAMLQDRGAAELANCVDVYTFDSSVNVQANLQYKADFDVGDVVTCIDKHWGIQRDQRITGITQTFEAGKQLIEATFGKSSPTLLDIIKRVR